VQFVNKVQNKTATEKEKVPMQNYSSAHCHWLRTKAIRFAKTFVCCHKNNQNSAWNVTASR